MGLLKHLLFWPVTGPTFLTRFSIEKAHEAARTELIDDSAVREALMELNMELEIGAIDEASFLEREAALMERMREVREWRERFDMPVSGGIVRVADEEDEPPRDDGAGEGP